MLSLNLLFTDQAKLTTFIATHFNFFVSTDILETLGSVPCNFFSQIHTWNKLTELS